MGKKFLLVVVLAFLTGACGNNALKGMANKNSDEARRIEAQDLINSGDSSAAISALQSSCPNNVCADSSQSTQLASAYMSEAGLDTITVIKNAQDLANGGSIGISTNDTFAVISTVLPKVSPKNLNSINNAINTLTAITDNGGTLNADQKLQLGMAQISAAVMSIGVGASGTVTCSSSTTVMGTDTEFTTLFSSGATSITVAGNDYTVASVDSNTSLTLDQACSPSFTSATFRVDGGGGFDTSNGLPSFCSGNCTSTNTSGAMSAPVAASVTTAGTGSASGTVSCSSTALTGTSTAFTSSLTKGGSITVSGSNYTIASVTDDTNAVLSKSCSPTFSGQSFTVVTTADYVADMMNKATTNISLALEGKGETTTTVNQLTTQVANSGGSCANGGSGSSGVTTLTGIDVTSYLQNCM